MATYSSNDPVGPTTRDPSDAQQHNLNGDSLQPVYRIWDGSRFVRETTPNNIYDRLNHISSAQGTTFNRLKIVSHEQTARHIYADVPKDPQYEFTVDFSPDDGNTFTDPLVQPEGNRIFQMRLRFTQHVADTDMLAGIALRWYAAAGWVFADGLGSLLYDECVSNPTVITRIVRSPAKPQPSGFRVVLVTKYRG